MGDPDFFDDYFAYTALTEPPRIYARWCAISGIATLLGRNLTVPFGHKNLIPNQYIMLVGESGSRKSSAIYIMRKLLQECGYDTIAAERTSKEKFLLDLQDGLYGDEGADSEVLERAGSSLWKDTGETRECLIAADEFNDFVGNGNIDFLSMLGSLWDFDGIYKARVKNSKSVAIPSPTINMLAGNTSDRLASAIPIDAIGQGFTSRLLLIHGVKSDRKFSKPPTPSAQETQKIISSLQRIQTTCRGTATPDKEADEWLDRLYNSWKPLEDSRFAAYSSRRYVHLLKLCAVFAAARYETNITKRDCIYANTVLTLAELGMPKTFGEFGKAKNSGTANKIIEYLDRSDSPRSIRDIFRAVSSDIEKVSDLVTILQNLEKASKIQLVKDKGWLPLKKALVSDNTEFLDWSLIDKGELENG